MNLQDEKYNQYALCKEMLETAEVVKKFDPSVGKVADAVKHHYRGILLTGEGSSRIFPAKNAITQCLQGKAPFVPMTEGATQAMDYNLSDYLVLGASNSGKTKEVIRLFKKLQSEGHEGLLGLTSHDNTPLGELSRFSHVLNCGNEDAVAATKSVVEQGLYVTSLISHLNDQDIPDLSSLPSAIETCLTTSIPAELIEKAAHAETLYFSGRNNGVAEELTLKTNEITRKKSDFLEGTYGVHGIEEVMTDKDVVILVNPFESEEEKFATCLKDGVGLEIIAISDRQTRFPTIQIPKMSSWKSTLELCMGWNLLVEIGLKLKIDLDKPERARKVGNEFLG
jgi:glucosamine--fructose-6-phosphate aminotransferase (isomerizing)